MNPEDRKKLVLKVADFSNSDPDSLKPVIGTFHVSNIPINSKPLAYANNVVHYCELSAWIEEPPLLIKLLETWQIDEEFFEIKNRIEASGPPRFHIPSPPWDTCLLALNLPFLNREKTRKALKLFISPLNPAHPFEEPGARVLIVNGPPKSGKSYTLDYIKYIGSILTKNNCEIAWVDYGKQISSRFGAVELIKSLLLQISTDFDENSIPKLESQQPARWIIELVVFFIRRLAVTKVTWFLVLDGFDHESVPLETIEFIQRLADITVAANTFDLHVEKEEIPIRLILLGFKAPIPNFNDRLVIDNITPLHRKDIALYFQRYATYKKKSINQLDLEKIVDFIMGQAAAYETDPNRTKIIADMVVQIASDLFQQ